MSSMMVGYEPRDYWQSAFAKFREHRHSCRTCSEAHFLGPWCQVGLQLRNNWIDEESAAPRQSEVE